MPELSALAAIAHELHTQDNRITECPIFAVQQRVRDWHIDPNEGNGAVWINGDEEYREATESEGRLLRVMDDCGDDLGPWRRVGYRDRWEFVSAFLTEKGAQAYIRVNGHNLTDPRIYAYSGWRNAEWAAIRRALMEAFPEPEPSHA